MSANVPYKVKVIKSHEEIIEVSAITAFEALKMARNEPGVILAIEIVEEPSQ